MSHDASRIATMEPRSRAAFLALILVQAAHSVEEHLFRLYDVLGPARYISEFTGFDRATVFAFGNTALVLFGLWCYFARVLPGHRSARAFAWFWALLEIANALNHIALATFLGGYSPGVATAPLLLATAAWLVLQLSRS